VGLLAASSPWALPAAASLLWALLAAVSGAAPGALSPPPPTTPAAPAAAPPGKAAAPDAAAAASDRRRQNKALARRYLTEVLGAGKVEKLDEIVARTFVDRTPGAPDLRGPEAARQAQLKLRRLFSKVDYNPQELIAEDDRVAARYVVTATPRPEPGAPQPPPLLLNGIALFRIRGGRIEEVFVINDQVSLLRQLGYTLVPPGAGRSTASPAGGAASPASPPPASPPPASKPPPPAAAPAPPASDPAPPPPSRPAPPQPNDAR
jgi:predicted ester cyclase